QAFQARAGIITLHGAGTWKQGDIFDVKPLPTVRADRHGPGHVFARLVSELERRAIRSRPSIPPLTYGGYGVEEVAALLRQAVFVSGRMVLVRDTVEDLVVNQVIQTLGQNVTGDGEPGLKVVELRHT